MNKYILREWNIVGVLLFYHVAYGFITTLPSVMTPVITDSRNQNRTDILISKDQASWFITAYGLTGTIGFLILPAIMQLYGRRVTNILMNCISAVGSIVIACSSNITSLTIGRGIHGLAFPGILICSMIIAEYTHPRRRGYFILSKLSLSFAGDLLCRSLGLKLTWRQIAWVSVIPSVLGMVGTFTWRESPAWLAFVGRYKDCAKSFEYFRGADVKARKELKELLASQQELRKNSSDYGVSFVALFKAFRSKEFLNPLLIAVLLTVLICASGYNFLSVYLIEIMMKMTKSTEKAYYFAIGSDVVNILAILLTSYIIKIFKRRTLLFLVGSFAIIILGITCICNYLEVKSILLINWLTPSFLILYIFLAKISFFAISIVSKGELFPLQYRGAALCASGIVMAVVTSIVFKLTGVMLNSIALHGMLAVYLVICAVLLIILYFKMPETKDRTLQDIENGFFKLSIKIQSSDDDDDDPNTNLVIDGRTRTSEQL